MIALYFGFWMAAFWNWSHAAALCTDSACERRRRREDAAKIDRVGHQGLLA